MRLRNVSISLYVYVLGPYGHIRVGMTVQCTTSGNQSLSQSYTTHTRSLSVELEVSRQRLNTCCAVFTLYYLYRALLINVKICWRWAEFVAGSLGGYLAILTTSSVVMSFHCTRQCAHARSAEGLTISRLSRRCCG